MKLIDELLPLLRCSNARFTSEECGMFGDLMWPPNGSSGEATIANAIADPAFKIIGLSRYVAIGRVVGEIRFYAGPIPTSVDEPDEIELGVLTSLSDAVTFIAALHTSPERA